MQRSLSILLSCSGILKFSISIDYDHIRYQAFLLNNCKVTPLVSNVSSPIEVIASIEIARLINLFSHNTLVIVRVTNAMHIVYASVSERAFDTYVTALKN